MPHLERFVCRGYLVKFSIVGTREGALRRDQILPNKHLVDRNLEVGNDIDHRLRTCFDVFTPLYRIRSRRHERERLGDDIR